MKILERAIKFVFSKEQLNVLSLARHRMCLRISVAIRHVGQFEYEELNPPVEFPGKNIPQSITLKVRKHTLDSLYI